MLSSTTCNPIQKEHNDVQVSRSSTRPRIFARAMLKGLHQRGERSSMLPEQDFQPAYINLLPTELLTDILLYVLPEERRTIIRPFTRYPHMTLSHVCHHWRDTLFSIPSIWKSFTVAEQDPEQENKRLKRIIDRTFGRERARQASLRGLTHFWFSRMSSAQLARLVVESSSRSILPVLIKNLGRCEGLTLKLDQGSANDFLSIFTGDTSSLRTLCAVSCPEEEEAKVIYDAIMNSKALFESSHWQHLTRLSWYCQLMPFALVNLSIPQLKVLCIGSTITLEESLRFLSGCQHLIDVELSDLRIVQKPASLPVDKQLVLPSLHTLNIHCHMGEDPLDALDCFTLPSLNSLALCSSLPSASPRNYLALSGLYARSACRIDELCIHEDIPSADGFARYLAHPHLQSVETLRIIAHSIGDETLKLLKYSSADAQCLLPKLRKLDLRICSTTDGLVSDVVASRWRQYDAGNAPACLEEVCVIFDENHSEELHERHEMMLHKIHVPGRATDFSRVRPVDTRLMKFNCRYTVW